MSEPDKQQETKAPGHVSNQGQPPRETRKPDAEERHHRGKGQTPGDEDMQGGHTQQKRRLREVLR
jgi:hypothetical protein